MPLSYQCANCSHTGQALEKFAGRIVKCPKCKEPIELGVAEPSSVEDALGIDKPPVVQQEPEQAAGPKYSWPARPGESPRNSPQDDRKMGSIFLLLISLFLAVISNYTDMGIKSVTFDYSISDRMQDIAIARFLAMLASAACFCGFAWLVLPTYHSDKKSE